MKLNFIKEFNRLVLAYPLPEVFGHSNENALGDYIYHNEDTYMCFDAGNLSRSAYVFETLRSNDCVELSRSRECELCYMCDDIYKCNNCNYISTSRGLVNCSYCFNCGNSQDCFGCSGIWDMQYVFFNRRLKKEEYFAEVKKMANLPPIELLQRLKKLSETLPLPSTIGVKDTSSNTDYGDEIYRSQNIYMGFGIEDSQNVMYSYDSDYCVDCVDMMNGYKSEGCYNCVDTGRSSNCINVYFSYRCLNCAFCFYCSNCQNCLGCSRLDGKQFCVLNRPVIEQKFNEIREKVLKNPDVEIDI